jgi:FkbM family methyltransferase
MVPHIPGFMSQEVCRILRRAEFPGKRRLRGYLELPSQGLLEVRFPEGMTLRLDLSESIQRDFYAGLYDREELALVGILLGGGGDFVDVGAHIGSYSVFAARRLRGHGRVLAFEPNPIARQQLRDNLDLNRCDNVVVLPAAASSARGTAVLHVPVTNDPSFSTLESFAFDEVSPLVVQTVTVDDEVERLGLEPAVVKIDVQDHELSVLAGMARTLEGRPALLVEVGAETGASVERLLEEAGYMSATIGPRGIRPGPIGVPSGYVNGVFLPGESFGALGRRGRVHRVRAL